MNSKNQAQIPTSFTPGALRRGFDEICIEINKEEAILPPDELLNAYKARAKQLERDRDVIWKLMGCPNKLNFNRAWKHKPHKFKNPELAKLYIDTGRKLKEIYEAITQINNKTRNGTLPFSLIFLGVAREFIDEETFKKISEKSQQLENQGFQGTREEWTDFVKSL